MTHRLRIHMHGSMIWGALVQTLPPARQDESGEANKMPRKTFWAIATWLCRTGPAGSPATKALQVGFCYKPLTGKGGGRVIFLCTPDQVYTLVKWLYWATVYPIGPGRCIKRLLKAPRVVKFNHLESCWSYFPPTLHRSPAANNVQRKLCP